MYLNDEFIMEKLNTMDEHKMAKEIFTPLLRKKGLKGVRFTGGSDEEGIDIEYYEKSNADSIRLYAGIQFKKGNITYSSRAKHGTVDDLKNQAEAAFQKDILDVNSGGVNHISRFIVATTGEINEKAREMINKAKNRGEQVNISYWDCGKLADNIRTYYLNEFIEYFNIDENEEIEELNSEDFNVTSDYIRENYNDLVQESKKCIKIMSYSQKEIVNALINNFFAGEYFRLPIGDLLYELGKQEDYIKDDLIALQRFDIINFDDEDTISLSERAKSIIKLATAIVDEMVSAEEYDNEEAKNIFDELIS